jgi:exopolysaccharide production protein ExoQ
MDYRKDDGTSKSLWLPLLWMFLAGSRYVSQWIDLGTAMDPMDVYAEGSPVDRAVFLALIFAGVVILFRRKPNWSEWLIKNKWLCLYFIFCLFSVLWSDDLFVSLKRWTKAIGTVVMVLIILTEKRPYVAFGITIRRLSIILIPLSILFIKYYPDLGRAYQQSQPMFTGVAYSKNTLGQLCLLAGTYFTWCLFLNSRAEYQMGGSRRILVDIIFLGMTAWLQYYASSSTSFACLLAAVFLFTIGRSRTFVRNPSSMMALLLLMTAIFILLEYGLHVSDWVIRGLGREPDLTTRWPMWEMLLNWDINPWIGVGYESFWSGERLIHIWQQGWLGIIQSHNGYLDIYLNVGMIGLFLMLLSILSGFKNTMRQMKYDYKNGTLKMALIIVVLLYNWTEAAIKPINNMTVLLLIGILDIPKKADRNSCSSS